MKDIKIEASESDEEPPVFILFNFTFTILFEILKEFPLFNPFFISECYITHIIAQSHKVKKFGTYSHILCVAKISYI